MENLPLNVDRKTDQIVISGEDAFASLNQGSWNALKLDEGRLLLFSKESNSSPEKSESFAKCSIDVLHDLLIGLNHRKWSGLVSVDTGFGQKKLYFTRGELTFAGSSLIDDRLGEVIYRESMITLDQLTNTAVQVDRSTKFGQVLLRDGVFSNTDLWNALKRQVLVIFRSVFLVSDVFVEIMPGTPPTEVTFPEGTDNLIDLAYSSGLQFRSFFQRLRTDSTIMVSDLEASKAMAQGTFFADMLQLAAKHPTIANLLEVSKLTDINTLWVLHKMVSSGLVSLAGLRDSSLPQTERAFSQLVKKVQDFSQVVSMLKQSFESQKLSFPLSEFRDFVLSLNQDSLEAIYLDGHGDISPDCLTNLYAQCHGSERKIAHFMVALDSMIRYSLQLAGDLLPRDLANKIRDFHYKNSSSSGST